MNIRASLRFFVATLTLMVFMHSMTCHAEELEPGLFKTVLDNGLTVLVRETPGSRAATVQFWVRAGSVYEEPQEAGITHFIEHMIFKGTPTRGPGELAGAIESVGGRINAYTSFEYTVYHATLTSRHWQLALDVLGDALLHSSFDEVEIEREKKVVLEEVGMRKDRPNIMLFQEMMTNAFKVHPYRLPVIGSVETISSFSREAVLRYLEKHYHPENFTVIVVGDLDAEVVTGRVKELMGVIPRGNISQPQLPLDPQQQEPRLFSIVGDIQQPQMALGIPITPFRHPDSPVIDVISEIVGHGETSRLYRSLRDDKGLVYDIHSSAFTPHDPGLFEIFATVDGNRLEDALEAALTELFSLKYHEVSEEELVRAKRILESDFVFNLERVEGQARALGSFEFMAGDPREDHYLEQVRSVSREDILRVANRYFSGSRLTAGFLVPEDSVFVIDEKELGRVISAAEKKAVNGTDPSLKKSVVGDVHRYVLANGIRLLVREDPIVPTVAIRAVMPGGLRSETAATNGAFAFISEALPKGTETRSAREIADAVADMAGSLGGFSGKNTFGLKGDFLSRFLRQAMGLFGDIIKNPAFDPDEVEKIRPELLARLKQQEDSLPALAFREFNTLLFDRHPYGLNSLGTAESLGSLDSAQLNELYRTQARPDNLVLSISGDVKADEVASLVTSLLGSWQGSAAEQSAAPTIELPPILDKPIEQEIPRDKEQVHIIIGFLGTTMTSSDRYGLEVLDTLLSGQSGRLFTELRDNMSLAYSLSSFSLSGLDTGSFGIYIGTSPDKKEKAIDEIWKQLQKVRQEPPGEDELERAKNIIISQYEMGLQTHGAQAMEMALNEAYELGQDFGELYTQAIAEVGADDVVAAARKFILADGYVMVTVGARK